MPDLGLSVCSVPGCGKQAFALATALDGKREPLCIRHYLMVVTHA
jgi:hypothetical protein